LYLFQLAREEQEEAAGRRLGHVSFGSAIVINARREEIRPIPDRCSCSNWQTGDIHGRR
jgi:hypothetical protein